MLENIDGNLWKEFLSSPTPIFLMIGKTDCPACDKWTEELTAWLNDPSSQDYKSKIRFGKLALNTPGLTDFKREHTPWLKEVYSIPFNTIWVAGRKVKSWDGNGIDRLTNRLDNVLLPVTPSQES